MVSSPKTVRHCGFSSWQDYPWPIQTPESPQPVWTGNGFKCGDRVEPILRYDVGVSGWSEELTSLHEEVAGADHPIDHASRNHVIRQLRKYLPCPSSVILEIGCSSGFMLRQIIEEFPQAFVIGADYVAGPLFRLASQLSNIPLLQFDLTRCPLPSASIDAVILLNVLEHIAKDEIALAHVARILRPGGIAIIEVPAGPGLYDAYDQFLKHHRRYSAKDLKATATKMNMEVLYDSHLGFFLYPAFWWVKRNNQKWMNKDYIFQQQVVQKNISETRNNRWIKFIMNIEQFLGRLFSYPLGIRCLLTCKKLQ
jgi:SAM-dependent methyltransferase